jgi:hypothetical protein
MDYVKLFKTIEDDDFYIIKRSIDKNTLDEWERTINILQTTEKDHPEEINYLNKIYQDKIKNYINGIIKKYKYFYNHEIVSIKNEYYKFKESLTNGLHIIYRLESHMEIKNKEEMMDNIMITIGNNLWHKEDKNIFFIKFNENKTEIISDMDNFYEINKIGNISLVDEYKENNDNLINRIQIRFANQVSYKVCKCIITSWEHFVRYRDSFRIPKINNNKYVMVYDRYEDPPLKITFDNRSELSKEEIDNFKIMTNNLTVFDNDNILIDKISFITNFVNKELIMDKIRSLINNKDFKFNNSTQYEINDSECIDNIENSDNIDNQLHSLRLSKL